MAKRRVGGATRASAQKGLLSPIPWAQWRMASLVATSIYGSGRGTALPIRERSDSRASGVMVGNRAVGMWQLWSGLGRRSRRRSIGSGCSQWTRRLLPARLSLPRGPGPCQAAGPRPRDRGPSISSSWTRGWRPAGSPPSRHAEVTPPEGPDFVYPACPPRPEARAWGRPYREGIQSCPTSWIRRAASSEKKLFTSS